jgi:hypothetical protein
VFAMGEKLFDETDKGIKKQIQSNLGKQVITKDVAQIFLQKVKKRAEGDIESPVIEYMLSVKYLSYPVGEFLEGYRQTFNSDGHKKAQGLKVVLQLPTSWKAKEGNRPHIVQKWVSANGTGLEMMLLDIRDADGYSPSDKEIESFVSSGKVKNIVPNGATLINSGTFSLEGRKGYWIEKTPTEEGVRNLKRSIETIVSKINVSRLNAHNLLKLPFTIKDFKIPISITKEIVNVLLDDKLFTDLPPAFMYT